MHDWDHLTRTSGPKSRSINAENRTGAAGAGGQASGPLGPGRKGQAFLPLPAGETLTLADIHTAGTIRHIWMTVPDTTDGGAFVLRDLVLRMYWDDHPAPSVEVPLGDFFCNGFATRALVTSEPVVVAPTGGMNAYFAMPFRSRARITLESQHPADIEAVFFQIDYTEGDQHHDDTGLFHAHWSRNTPAADPRDHLIVNTSGGSGKYIGTYVALTALSRYWWGEGETKFFIDGDTALPTIVGTGLEDYVGGAWAFQDELVRDREPEVHTFSAPYFGYPYRSANDTTRRSPYATPMPPSHGMYRWHLPDPIYYEDSLRVTLQQIGHDGTDLFERRDDISTVAYWYQSGSRPELPPLPEVTARRPL